MTTTFNLHEFSDQIGRLVEGRHDEIDVAHRLPDDVAEALIGSGALRIWLPSELGGPELCPADGLGVMEEASRLDGAVGWCVMIGVASSLLAASMSEAAAQEVFSSHRSVLGGHTTPVGRAVPVDGGIRVDAQWQWGSGIHHCNWMGGGALLEEGGEAVPVFVVLPIDKVEILDTWRPSGMQGTGSTDYRTVGAFVPEGFYARLGEPQMWIDKPIYKVPTIALLSMGVGAVGLGLGQRALEEFALLARDQRLLGTTGLLKDSPTAQATYARAEAAINSARSYFYEVIGDVWDVVLEDGSASREQRRRLRLAATHAASSAAEAITSLHYVAGGAVIHRSHPFQRLFRDVHVVTQHIRVSARTWEMIGAGALAGTFDGQV